MLDDSPIIWLRPEATGRGRPPAYNRSQIARTSIAIADAEGLAAVTMRRVAAALGAGTMSLYRYVHTKDELHFLMLDEVIPEPQRLDRGGNPPWRAALRTLAFTIRDLVRRHAWLPEVAAAVGLPGPKGARGIDAVMSVLEASGMSDTEISQAVYTVLLYSIAATQIETAEAGTLRRTGRTNAQRRTDQQRYLDALAAGQEIPTLHRVTKNVIDRALDADAVFTQILERVLDGLATFKPRDT